MTGWQIAELRGRLWQRYHTVSATCRFLNRKGGTRCHAGYYTKLLSEDILTKGPRGRHSTTEMPAVDWSSYDNQRTCSLLIWFTMSNMSLEATPCINIKHVTRSNPIRRSGKLLGNLTSAFVAEAVFLEWCLDVFVDWYG